jgi:glycosyltransferase involved in cell wall biosynthesis
MRREKLALWGIILCLSGLFMYVLGVILALPRKLFYDTPFSLILNESLVWYSGAPILLGFLLILIDLFILFPKKRKNEFIKFDVVENSAITVVLTAYNDESSIALAVRDFLSHHLVKRVIVISNNSKDNTEVEAQKAGALVFNEPIPGYGSCVHRALSEGLLFDDTDLIVLCEGDMTFSSYCIDKLIAYIPHADIVNGTRIVEQLRDKDTQLSTFMFYGNLFVAKLLEIKHLGNATFTDVGTTYKIFRKESLKKLLPLLDKHINLEFNPYLLDIAVQNNLRVLECPVAFHKRVGLSKGGNLNNFVALKLGFRMIKGIIFGWR